MTGRSSWKNSFLPCILVSSWNSHWWVTAQWGAAQEAIPHYSKCLWLNNNCSSNGVLLIYKCILWKPRFSVTVKKKKRKKYPTLFNQQSLADTCLCTPLARVMWGLLLDWSYCPGKIIYILDSAKKLSPEVYPPSTNPWMWYTQDYDNFYCGERDTIQFATFFS